MGELFNSPQEWTPPGRRADARAQDRSHGRDPRRQDRVARPGRCLAYRARRQRDARRACRRSSAAAR
jgi:hypothetical protein